MCLSMILYLCPQAQYVFIHDALNEYITCGETEITASNLRAKFTYLSKQIPGKGITGFMNQFQVRPHRKRSQMFGIIGHWACRHLLHQIIFYLGMLM